MKVTVVIVMALLSINVFSAEDAKIEKAKELIKAMDVTKNIDASFEQITKFSEKMVDSQNLTKEQATKAKELARKSMEISFKNMKKIDWETIFSEIYASVFTEKELQELIDFYKSPIGKKLLEKQPQLMRATMQKMQTEMAKLMPQIQKDIRNAIENARE